MSLNNMNNMNNFNSYSNIPVPPPLPQQNLMAATNNNSSALGNRRLATRQWSNMPFAQQGQSSMSQYSTTTTTLPSTYSQQTTTYLPQQQLQQTYITAAPAAAIAPSNVLPAPINDGRRYARLTGQKAGSNRARRHLVQPLNNSGLQTLPAGVPVEGLAAASQGRRGRRAQRNMTANSAAFQPTLLSHTLPAQQQFVQQQAFVPQQQFVAAPTQFVSAAPAAVGAPSMAMLPAPINDGRRYARLTGQKAGSRRARRHLVQPLNNNGLQSLPAGVPVEGLAAASQGTGGRRAIRSARNNGSANTGGFISLDNGMSSNAPLSGAPLSSGFASSAPLSSGLVSAPMLNSGSSLSALPAPHLAQIPLGAPKVSRAQKRSQRRGRGGLAANNGLVAAPLSNVTMIKQEPVIYSQQPSLVGTPVF